MSIKTKFGKAKIDKQGYYTITSRKEGNNMKRLHRLIFEDFWGVELTKDISVHHKDGNKINNCILNLEAMNKYDHAKLHNAGENNNMYNKNHSKISKQKISESKKGEKNFWYGKHHSKENRVKMSNNISKALNGIGFYRVSKCAKKGINQGFLWTYAYKDFKGSGKQITSVDLFRLKEKVIKNGLEWKIIDYDLAKSTCKKYKYNLEELR